MKYRMKQLNPRQKNLALRQIVATLDDIDESDLTTAEFRILQLLTTNAPKRRRRGAEHLILAGVDNQT